MYFLKVVMLGEKKYPPPRQTTNASRKSSRMPGTAGLAPLIQRFWP